MAHYWNDNRSLIDSLSYPSHYLPILALKNMSMPLKIAFISTVKGASKFRSDASYIYRCENLGKQLTKDQHSVSFLHINEIKHVLGYDVLVFHRPFYTWRLKNLVWQSKLFKKLTLIDFDDLIFDERFTNDSPAIVNAQLSFEKMNERFKSHQSALGLFRFASVTTAPLADAIKQLFPHIDTQIIANAVHVDWFDIESSSETIAERLKSPVITYFPGTKSHNKDFATIAPELVRFLQDHPHVKLNITGHLDLDPSLNIPPEQLIHNEKVVFSEYKKIVRDGWVNLAPLETSVFTQCKSAIKVIEAGFWKKPTLCTNTPDNQRFLNKGAVIYKSKDEIYQLLKDMLEPSHYERCVDDLRNKTLKEASPILISNIWQKWVARAQSTL